MLLLAAVGCPRGHFPDVPAGYREFAYVSNGASNTVSVLDLVYLRPDRTLQVGTQPTGLAVNPVRDEVYAVNSGSDTVSIIDTSDNAVTATIGVHRAPYSIDVAPDGKRAYVPNSGSNSVSVLDLNKRREIAIVAAGEGPGVARVSPDNRSLVVSNRIAGSVSVYSISDSPTHPLQFREAFSGCPAPQTLPLKPMTRPTPKAAPRPLSPAPAGIRSWTSGSPQTLPHGTADRTPRCSTTICSVSLTLAKRLRISH